MLRHRIASDRRLNADRFYATPCSRHAVCGWGLVYCLPLDIIRRLNGSNSGTVRYRRSVWLLSPAVMSIVSQHTDSLTGNDLLLVYKILFGLLRVNSDIFFTRETSHNYAVTHICYTNSDASLLIDATFQHSNC